MTEGPRVALITGGSGGIGAALVRTFARRGFRVVVNYRQSEAPARALRDAIAGEWGPGAALAVRADVASRSQVAAMFDWVHDEFGRVDVLIAGAGVNRDAPFLEMGDDEWSAVVGTILTGTFVSAQEFARRFAGDDGHIVTIGALTAIRGRKNGANYCSARAGVLALTKCLALELAPRIRVNCLTPGYIETDEVVRRYQLDRPEQLERAVGAVPLGRLGTPDDVARMVEFLVCESSYVTGQNFLVDGGMLMR
jgi:3-oxoacyl-[acyl-carrier protein] reductase